MRTAEKAGRIFFTLIGILGVMLLLLPQIGISVDSIMSGSMEPVLRTGGIVFTDTKERRPEIGDIVTYQVGETRVTHRVIRKEHKGYFRFPVLVMQQYLSDRERYLEYWQL